MAGVEDEVIEDAPQNSTEEAEPTDIFAALLKEMQAINSNISLMHNDINNLVVDTNDPTMLEEGEVDDHDGAEATETTETASVASVDAKVARLLTSTQTAHKESVVTSSNNLLSSIAQDLTVSEPTASAVHENLASIVTGLLKDKLPEDKVDTKSNKYLRPANIENLRSPRVNKLIWNNISPQVRSTDTNYQRIQKSLVGAISAMVHAANLAIQNNSGETLITALTDGIAIATQGQHDLNQTRRVAMKKDLHPDLAVMCNNSVQSGESLFGDLSQLTKDITETNKLTKKVRSLPSSSGRGPRYTDKPTRSTAVRTAGFSRINGLIFIDVLIFSSEAGVKERSGKKRGQRPSNTIKYQGKFKFSC